MHNVTLKVYETFIELISKKSLKIKIIKASDVKKMHRVHYNKMVDDLTINIILFSGKVIKVYNVDNSVFDKVNRVL
jgi:hypothetical protein